MRFCKIILLVSCLVSFPALGETSLPPVISSVAIIRVPEPLEIVTMNKGSLLMAFGGLGAGLAALDAYQNQKGLLGALARTKFSFSDQLSQDLAAALNAQGLKTTMVKADRKGRPDKLLEDYSTVAAEGASTILDVSLANLGYATENWLLSPHWRPEVNVRASLVLSATGERLYEERIMYGLHNPFMSAAKLDAPKAFQFADQDALDAADDDTLIGGLKDASKSIAAHVAKSLPTRGSEKAATP